jgi:S1-C subfamily serine protease
MRFQALLLTGLLAAPAGAVAKPSDQSQSDSWTFEKTEWSTTSKGRLGVMVMGLTDELRAYFGSTNKTGVLVARVEPGSPAARAGIAPGDMIVDVRGHAVDDAGDIIATLADAPNGGKVMVKALRDKKLISFEVTLDRDQTTGLDTLPGLSWLRDWMRLPPLEHSKST